MQTLVEKECVSIQNDSSGWYVIIELRRVSEWLLLNANSTIFQLYHGENKIIFNEMIMSSALYKINMLSWIFIVLAHWNKSAERHVAPLGHIILIPNQPAFALTPLCCVLSGEATNTNCIVFGLIRSQLEPNIYRTRSKHAHHYMYATDALN